MQFREFHKWLSQRFDGLTLEALLEKAGLLQSGGAASVIGSVMDTSSVDFQGVVFTTFSARSASGIESDRQFVVPRAGTLANLFVNPNAGPAADIVIVVRKNGTNTALTVTLPATETDVVSDIVNSVALVAGDVLTLSITNQSEDTNYSLSGLNFTATLG